jgi:hypothetical protein
MHPDLLPEGNFLRGFSRLKQAKDFFNSSTEYPDSSLEHQYREVVDAP